MMETTLRSYNKEVQIMKSFTTKLPLVLTIAFLPMLSLNNLAFAQDNIGQDEGDGLDVVFDEDMIVEDEPIAEEGDGDDPIDFGGEADTSFEPMSASFSLTAEYTRTLTRRMSEINEYCGPVDSAYRIDCLAEQYRQIAKSLPKHGDHRRVSEALHKAADDLEAIVAANLDTAAPTITPAPQAKAPRAKAVRKIRAVQKKRIVVAERAAAKVVTELETVLLRSSESSRRRKKPFEQVAAVVNSNKRLLRSA